MIISFMKPEHVAQIAELEQLCFTDPWSESSISAELESKLSLWLVAMEGERVVGYVGSQTVLGWTDMMNIAVHPDFRRRGIGEGLVAALEEELKKQGSQQLTLEVRASNESAKALYSKLGFREVGIRKNYYHKPREDALILRKEWEV